MCVYLCCICLLSHQQCQTQPTTWLRLQDIPRTTDHAPSRTFYTFRVSTDNVCFVLAGNLYQAALNVRLRLQHEMLQEKEVRTMVMSAFSGHEGNRHAQEDIGWVCSLFSCHCM